jgi:peptidyl-prolyl cis-trans isomerase B (cyclophilin B)
MRRRSMLAVTVLATVFALTGAASAAPGPATQPSDQSLTTPTRSATANTTDACTYAPVKPKDKFRGIPTYDATAAAKPYVARLFTTQGVITFQALTDKAPCTTFSFRYLAVRAYYNLTHCHRLTTARIYVLQCGDPTGTGSGGPGYQFPDENLTGATYPAGTVAMANAGPGTNGSQFFFTWKDTTLRPNYTPFGRVIGGMDVLAKIAAAGQDDQNGEGDGYPTAYTEFLHVQVSAH